MVLEEEAKSGTRESLWYEVNVQFTSFNLLILLARQGTGNLRSVTYQTPFKQSLTPILASSQSASGSSIVPFAKFGISGSPGTSA
jgi:hypothetical protein